MKTPRHDRLILCGAAMAAAFSWGACGYAEYKSKASRLHRAHVTLSRNGYAPVDLGGRPAEVAESWEPPTAQSRGEDWIYDVFTPPEVFYDSNSKAFTVAPPVIGLERNAGNMTDNVGGRFGLVLLGVRRTLFRLQLVGFAGGPGSYVGVFEDVATTEIMVAGKGRRVARLNLVIEEFDVGPKPLVLPDSMTTLRLAATAVIRDELSGSKVTLSNLERCYADTNVATLASDAGTDRPIDARIGDTVSVGGDRFRIDSIRLNPPTVEVSRERSDASSADRRTLVVPLPAEANRPRPDV